MWANPIIPGFTVIAVHTKDLKIIRVILSDDKSNQLLTTTVFAAFPARIPIVVDMVHAQKFRLYLTAASTKSTIMIQNHLEPLGVVLSLIASKTGHLFW